MKMKYLVEITEPKSHIVNITIDAQREGEDQMTFFLPSWSPGSYLMREYARNIRSIKFLSGNGEHLLFRQETKNTWIIDIAGSSLKQTCKTVQAVYEVYCHELTVRTSHVDESHAFLHGPSYLMGLLGCNQPTEIEFRFPGLWSKLHTSMKDISTQREKFLYHAPSYDDLLDCPVEIGCHESDGFMVGGKEHHLIWYGQTYPHELDLKQDIKKIVETVSSHFGELPYDNYLFITHFKKNLYGGLEHKSSTALHFDGRKIGRRGDYLNWLALVAHEYFHTWNVKRIRPIELGPFDYLTENYTRQHWLTEGLTSFMDELFVYRADLCTLEEYLEMQAKNLQRYFEIVGKKFHSLEDSSFNAWIKLYRPDENSRNSSISYYLKGGLVFSTLHFDLVAIGKSIDDLLQSLWKRYKDQPEKGMTADEIFQLIESIGGSAIRERFELRVSTTEDIDFESYYLDIGAEFDWEDVPDAWLGVQFKFEGDRVIAASIDLDSPAFQAGINAQDEIIAINGIRVLKNDVADLPKMLQAGKRYSFAVSRLGQMIQGFFIAGKQPRRLRKILIKDRKKLETALQSK